MQTLETACIDQFFPAVYRDLARWSPSSPQLKTWLVPPYCISLLYFLHGLYHFCDTSVCAHTQWLNQNLHRNQKQITREQYCLLNDTNDWPTSTALTNQMEEGLIKVVPRFIHSSFIFSNSFVLVLMEPNSGNTGSDLGIIFWFNWHIVYLFTLRVNITNPQSSIFLGCGKKPENPVETHIRPIRNR